MPALNINEDDLFLIKDLLNKWVPNAIVKAYGSRIKGTSHAGSDLDLVIINPNDPDKPTSQISDLKQACAESNIPILIDIMDWAYLPPAYREEINKLNIIIQA